MSLGYFNKTGDQYVITSSMTPGNWENYLFNENYYMEISQTAQGHSRCEGPVLMEYTGDYRQFYLLDLDSKEYHNINCRNPEEHLDSFQCTHALVDTTIQTCAMEIESTIHVFVPSSDPCEIWSIRIKNKSSQTRELSLFSLYSFTLRGTTGITCDYDSKTDMIWADGNPDSVFFADKEANEKTRRYIYMFSTHKAASYDCSKWFFYGNSDITRKPRAIENGCCYNSKAENEDTIGCFEHRLTLLPGEEKEVSIILGVCHDKKVAYDMNEKYREKSAIKKEYEKADLYWKNLCKEFHIETADNDLNHFVNYWLKKQVDFSSRINRANAIYPVRNPLQDAVGYSMLNPEFAKQKVLEIAATQESNGYLHMWQRMDVDPPLPMIGMCHLKHKDSGVWLVTCTCMIAQETGDIEFIKNEVGFADSKDKKSLYEHLLLAISYMEQDKGEHGLCLMGDGDWNDPLNGAGYLCKGESTWTTMGLKYSLLQIIPICKKLGDNKSVIRFQEMLSELDEVINEHCFDEDWYIAGYNDNGVPFGTKSDEEGQVLLNAQSWAIMSKTAKGTRLQKVFKTIDQLDTPCGPQTISPPFTKWNSTWGRISYWVPGTHENGGVYCHASMFKAFADCLMGRGEEAYDTISKTMPTNGFNPPEINRQIPIYVPNCYFGIKESMNFGRSTASKVTGTAAWMMYIVLEYMVGLKATIEGLRIQPCIPKKWETIHVTRKFRGATYHIKIMNPAHMVYSLKTILVNGKEIEGDLLPYSTGMVYHVDVLMG